MIPSPWAFTLLTLGTFRIVRFLGWDNFPPVEKARACLLRGRPLLTDLFQCPFCLGAWVSIAVYLAWWAWPRSTLAVAAVAAISAAVGLVAKNLDG